MVDHGPRSGRSTAPSACSATCPSGRSPRSSTRASTQAGLEEAHGPRHVRAAAGRASSTSSRATSWSPPRDELEPGAGRLEAAARVEPELRRGQGHGRRVLRRAPRRGAGASTPPTTTCRCTRFERGGKKNLDDDPTRIDRITQEVPRHRPGQPPHPLRHRPGAAGDRAGGRCRASRRRSPRPIRRRRSCPVIMQRDLGDRRFPGIMLTISSGIMFGSALQHAPPP